MCSKFDNVINAYICFAAAILMLMFIFFVFVMFQDQMSLIINESSTIDELQNKRIQKEKELKKSI